MFDIETVGQNIGSNIKIIESVTDAMVSFDDETAIVKSSSPTIEGALESEFNSPEELRAKKLMSAALLIAKEMDVLPPELPTSMDAIDATAIADEAIAVAKVGYQVATGEIGADEAIDIMVDRATVRALAVADTLVEVGVDVAVKRLSTAIAVAYPPAIPVVVALNMASPYIKEKVKPLVKKGIVALNTIAKPIVKKMYNTVKETVKTTVSNVVKRLLVIS